MAENKNTDVDRFDPETGVVTLADSTIADTIAALSAGMVNDKVYATIKGEDFASRLLISKALSSSLPIADNLGKTINLVEVVLQKSEMENEQSHELEDVARVILIDEDGMAYHAMSRTLFRDVTQNILALVPDTSKWSSPIPIKVTKEGKAPRAYYTLTFA